MSKLVYVSSSVFSLLLLLEQFCFAACVMRVFVGVVVLDHSHITLQPKTGCRLKQG